MNLPIDPTPAPLLSKEKMAWILSHKRSLTSVQAYQEMSLHLGRPLSPARKPVLRNGRKVWVSC